MTGKPRVGISSCLLGERVRWDGAHALDPYLRDTLGRHVEWVPVCPEVELGYGIPREPMTLKGEPASPRLVDASTGRDRTEGMLRWAEKKMRELDGIGLSGFVFKSGSPSCSTRGVKVLSVNKAPPRRGSGVFARAFMRRCPLLPAVDEKGMADPSVREGFIERVFVYARWRECLCHGDVRKGLSEFHASHELLVAAHDPTAVEALARIIARAGSSGRQTLEARYGAALMRAIGREATAARTAKVLKAVYGRLNDRLSHTEKAPLGEVIEDYRAGRVPLLVPLVLMRHYVERFADPYLSRQMFLDPYPAELGLRAREH